MKEAPIIPLQKFQTAALPLKVQTIKHFAEEQDDLNEGPHSHNYYEMVWLTGGKGTLYVDLQEYAIDTNTIFFVNPGQAHQFQIREGMEGFVFSFTDSFIRDEYELGWRSQASLCQVFTKGRPMKITHEMEEDVKEIVLKMIMEFENEYSHRIELLKRYLKIFLIYLTRLDEIPQLTERSRETELVRGFLELLDKNFKEKKLVADYALQLLVTANYLNGVVKKNTGYSAGYHIRQRVVLEAKRMALYSQAGMKEIAYNLGFLDSSHFSKFFKTFGGANFTEFKKGALIMPLNIGFQRA